MKNLIIVFIAVLLFSCEQSFPEVVCQVGWLKGQTQGQKQFTLIRCTDNIGYIAGDNIAAGGTNLDAYEPGSISRTDVSECSECHGLYPN